MATRETNSDSRLWRATLSIAVTVGLAAGLLTGPAGAAHADQTPLPQTPSAAPTPSPTDEPSPTPAATPSATPEPSHSATPEPEPSTTPKPSPTSEPGRNTPEEVVQADALAADAVVPTASRIGDADRYVRAATASRVTFPDGADVAIVALGTASVGPTIAAGLAAQIGAPLLYTSARGVPSATTTELRRVKPATIIVVAGSGDIASAVYTSLGKLAPELEKLSTNSRFAGAQSALRRVATPLETVYLSGSNVLAYPLAAVAAASRGQGALMVDGTSSKATSTTVAALRATGAKKLVVVGGTGSVSTAYLRSLAAAGFSMSRASHDDLYSLAVVAGRLHPSGATRAMVANPDLQVDVAIAAAMAGASGQQLLYSPHACVLARVSTYISGLKARVLVVGRTDQLSSVIGSNTSCSVQKPRLRAALESAIRSTAGRYAGDYAVTVREIGVVGEVASVDGAARLEPASMMKLFAAWASLKRVQDGTASMSTRLRTGLTLRECLKAMIHASDNYCHDDIVAWIGAGRLNSLIAGAGFANTRYGNVAPGGTVLYAGNRSTTSDLTSLMVRINAGELLKGSARSHMLGLMEGQIWRSRIASGIPAGVTQRSKPGSLWIASGLLQADTAIIYGARKTFALSIIGVDNPSKAALRAITRTVYEHFNGDFGSAASYPVQQMKASKSMTLRSGPGGPVVTRISTGRLLEVTDAKRIWYKVRFGSRLLWADSRALRNR